MIAQTKGNYMKDYLDNLAKAYYEGNPIVTDDVWDYLADLYEYKYVGAKPIGKKIKHFHRLYSLQKYYENDKKPFGDIITENSVIITPKLDGAAVCLTYIRGEFVTAATRGDGIEGEDITHNFINWIPSTITAPHPILQIVGEVVAPKAIENSRNYAAGAIRVKSESEFINKEVYFYAYGVFPYIYSTYEEDMGYLEDMQFNTVLTKGNIVDSFPTDGLVYRINCNKEFENKGYTSHHPKGAFALKNSNDVEKVHTTLRDVIWQVGKSGKVTPVAIFDEIEIEGAKINKATLHNPGFIEDMNLCLGDTIIVTRAGGIIPKVIGVYKN